MARTDPRPVAGRTATSIDWVSMDAFDAFVASTDPAMIVVTAAADGERAGCLVGFHSQSSIDPRRYSVWLSKANRTYSVAMRASHLGVHFLTTTDFAIAELFGGHSGDDVDKFARVAWESGAGGVPLLTDLPHFFVGHRVGIEDGGGDHVCVTLEVSSEAAPSGAFEPLRLSDATHIVPSHDAGERR